MLATACSRSWRSSLTRRLRKRRSSGMKLVMWAKMKLGGTVTAQIGLRFGDEKSVFGREMAASNAGGVVMLGVKNKPHQQFQGEMDKLKSEINVGGGVTFASAGINT